MASTHYQDKGGFISTIRNKPIAKRKNDTRAHYTRIF